MSIHHEPAQTSSSSSSSSSTNSSSTLMESANLTNIWNNVKYGFHYKLKPRFSFNSPICILGEMYHYKMMLDHYDHEHQDFRQPSRKHLNNLVHEQFKRDIASRIWCSYRKHFPAIQGSMVGDQAFTSDCGWGCMVRSGQMMFAQALVVHFLGRYWRWNPVEELEVEDHHQRKHRMIVKWFVDDPDPLQCPFSIHELMKIGQKQCDKGPGDWFGPASISFILK